LIPTSTPTAPKLDQRDISQIRSMTPEERTEYFEEKKRTLDPSDEILNIQGFRGESYINQLYNNKSMGIDNIY